MLGGNCGAKDVKDIGDVVDGFFAYVVGYNLPSLGGH